MKYLFVFLVVCLTSSVIGQNRYHGDETFSVDEVCYLKKDSSLLNGVKYKEYENGQLMYETNYKEGKEDGLSRGWYENGKLWGEGNYKDGKPISEKCRDKDGNVITCP